MSGIRWSDEETEMLMHMIENQPVDRYPSAYNLWASAYGHPVRTRKALQKKASSLRVTDKSCGDWVSTGYVCAMLGVTLFTARYWTDCKGIPCHRGPNRRRFFRRSDLRKLAKQQPSLFAGIDADRLFLLLEDRPLADGIAARFPRRAMDPKPVRAVETGRRYASIRAAAEQVNVSRCSIRQAIRSGWRSAGYHWTFA